MEEHEQEQEPMFVFTASLVRAKKVQAYGVINRERGSLTITELEIISDTKGRFDERTVIDRANKLKSRGFVVQVEDTKGGIVSQELETVLLQDKDGDGRSKRDVRFDQYLRLRDSGKLNIDPAIRVHLPGQGEYQIETDPSSGRARYIFESEFDGDFRSILIMCGLVFNQPMDDVFMSEFIKGLGEKEEKEYATRVKESIMKSRGL